MRNRLVARVFALVALAALLAMPVSAQEASPAAMPSFTPGVVPTQYGDVAVPEQPGRVVTLAENALDAAVAVGVTPVGAVTTRGGDGVALYIAAQVPGIAIVGTAREVNIEAVVAQDPDLILAGRGLDEEVYKTLSELAPTIVPATTDPVPADQLQGWELDTLVYAHALGKLEAGQQVLADLDARIDALAAGAAAPFAGETATVLRWMDSGPVVMSANAITGTTLSRLGLPASDFAQGIASGHSDPLSLENLSEVDTDWLFVATFNADGQAAYDAVAGNATFQQLGAVQSGKVVVVNGSLWSSASGPLAAGAILDDVEAAMAGHKG